MAVKGVMVPEDVSECEELMLAVNTGMFDSLFGVLQVVSHDLDELCTRKWTNTGS
jgi:hypothetical protein